jgi:hypothetical protein
MMNSKEIVTFGISIGLLLFLVNSLNSELQKVQATGGAGEIKGLIDPIIDRAISAVQSNNSQLALEELYTLQQELDDTFSVDEEEEKEDDNKKD